MGVKSLPKTVTRQRRGCDLNPGHSAPESSTLTTRLPSHPHVIQVNDQVNFSYIKLILFLVQFAPEKHGKSSPFNSAHYATFYQQKGDRIVTIDSVTSFHRLCIGFKIVVISTTVVVRK